MNLKGVWRLGMTEEEKIGGNRKIRTLNSLETIGK